MCELGFASPKQISWRLDLIPFNPECPGTLFISPLNNNGSTSPPTFLRQDGTRLLLNDHLGGVLREHLWLLTEAMRFHNQRIAKSTFPLSTLQQGESTAHILDRIRRYQGNSHKLQAQMRMFKATWEANKSLHPPANNAFSCYNNDPVQWVDEVIAANDLVVDQATAKIDTHSQRIRQLIIENDQAEVSRVNIERARDRAGAEPPALLSYNDIVSMKPGTKRRHKMSNKEWRRFTEEAEQWFISTRMSGIPQTNQTRLMEATLDHTLFSRGMMKLREQYPQRNFFIAPDILRVAGKQRDPLLYPRVVQA